MAKNMPAMQEMHIHSVGLEDALEKEMATLMDRGACWAIVHGVTRFGHYCADNTHINCAPDIAYMKSIILGMRPVTF